ncbi:fluoride efflux transporter CrcB [Nocardioides sp. BP30]|uniref:fluoride efflux transporter CrcB n=1 Tax=Nocardioides sp. BP30 TaxID=3036374 RepID=UPI00246916AB|nr:fluoride efflux transporter CrcB [Nocardioides sp. BP30]WGL52155.1 fluoride efflux transporter CrcB [Nocardioides sp. BP30]
MTVLLVLLGGAIGAPTRYLTDLVVQSRHDTALPWGTISVNVVGSFVLGSIAGLASGSGPAWVLTLVGTGFCGALTTFSTFSYETVRLAEARRWGAAAANVAVSLVLGLLAVALGWRLGTL